VAISVKPQSKKSFLLRFSDRINVPDWAVYTLLVADFIYILLLKDPVLDAVALTAAISFSVAMVIRSLFSRMRLDRRQLRTLRAIGTAISSTISTPLALLAETTGTNACQDAGFLTPVSTFAYNTLSATPFLGSWVCSQVAIIVVIGLLGMSAAIIWACVDSLMTQQPLSVYVKPVLAIVLCISILAGVSSLLLYTGTPATN
jgi:hypothetical protein